MPWRHIWIAKLWVFRGYDPVVKAAWSRTTLPAVLRRGKGTLQCFSQGWSWIVSSSLLECTCPCLLSTLRKDGLPASEGNPAEPRWPKTLAPDAGGQGKGCVCSSCTAGLRAPSSRCCWGAAPARPAGALRKEGCLAVVAAAAHV